MSVKKTTMDISKRFQPSQLITYVQYYSIDEKDNVELTLCPGQVQVDMDPRI